MKSKILGIEITNPEKIVDSSSKSTKQDVVQYYYNISPLLLPFLESRLLSVIRCHQGADGDCFFKKHPTTEKEYVESFFDGDEEYFYIKNQKQLIYQAQMGTMEFHPWASKLPKLEKPNMMIFDLDPGENISIEKLRDGVMDLKEILDTLKLTSFLKTSGGKGYHIIVPFYTCKDWESFAEFSKQIASLLESKFPKKYTTNIRKKERNGKIFIDWLRNTRGATCASAYSLRGRENLPISCPISWKNLEKITPNEINIKNYKKYVKTNPWKDIFKIKQGLK